jgi:AraC-like DNA-binding protein/quercetin dioxygenase-like cupin family protein
MSERWVYNVNFFEERWTHAKDIKITAFKYETSNVPAHWHSEIEVMMVTKGDIIIGCNSEVNILTAGDCVVIPSGNIHYSVNENYTGQALLFVFSPAIFDRNAKELDGYSLPVIIRNIDIEKFNNLYESILSEIANADTAHEMIIHAYLSILSGWIIRNRTENSIINAKRRKSGILDGSQKLFRYIEENYHKKMTLETAANILYFNKAYFCRYFKELTGTTFLKYVNAVRIQAAQTMLSITDLKITEIASECGFDNIRTFTREFKLHTGMTAKQYKSLKKTD